MAGVISVPVLVGATSPLPSQDLNLPRDSLRGMAIDVYRELPKRPEAKKPK